MPVRYELSAMHEIASGIDEATYNSMLEKYATTRVQAAKQKRAKAPAGPISKLFPGDSLVAGKRMDPPNGKAYAVLDESGKFFIKDHHENIIWEAPMDAEDISAAKKSVGEPTVHYSTKGSFSIKSGSVTLFSAHTGMHKCHNNPPGRVEMQQDGNLVVHSSNGMVMWSSNTAGGKMSPEGARTDGVFGEGCKLPIENEIRVGQKLRSGEKLVAGMATLELRGDGRLRVMDTSNGRELWNNKQSNVAGGPFYLTLQPDGNLVVYNSDGDATWSPHLDKCTKTGTVARLDDTANFGVYSEFGDLIWNSDTKGFSKKRFDPSGDGAFEDC